MRHTTCRRSLLASAYSLAILPTLATLALIMSTGEAAAQQGPEVKDDPRLPRVLILGDSISIGYTGPVREALAGKANLHRAMENCGPTTRGLEKIDAWLADGKWDVIHFNWGLHDLKFIGDKHQVPIDQYEANLETLVARLEKTGAKLIWCSTTPVPEGKLNPPRKPADVVLYNQAAARVMAKHKVAIDDLYNFALPQLKQVQIPQNVHFTKEGSAVLGKEVARQIESALASPATRGGE